jgi:hypothetical protein
MTSYALAVLRALIREDIESAERAQEAAGNKTWEEAGGLEVGAAFYILATRRFEGKPLAEIVRWVADTRAEMGEGADEVEPVLAEALLRANVRGEYEKVVGVDKERAVQLQAIMAARLGLESNFSDAELDSFLSQAEQLAATWETE